MKRGPMIGLLIAIVAAAGLIIYLMNRDTGTAPETTASPTVSTTTDGGTASGPTVTLTSSDGLDSTLDVTSCDNPGETTISLRASNESADLELDATGGTGTIVFDSSDGRREGTVDSVQVGDTGNITASGSLTPADDSASPATFELNGSCA